MKLSSNIVDLVVRGTLTIFAVIPPGATRAQSASPTTEAVPTPKESSSPELTLREWAAAMEVGDSSRAVELSEVDEPSKAYIQALSSSGAAAIDLKLAAAQKFGDAGYLIVGKEVHVRTFLPHSVPAIVAGKIATIRDPNSPHGELQFILIGKEWKFDLTGQWYQRMTGGNDPPLELYLQLDRTFASEAGGITAQLNSDKIRSTDDLYTDLKHMANKMALLRARLAPTRPSTAD